MPNIIEENSEIEFVVTDILPNGSKCKKYVRDPKENLLTT